LKQPMKNKSADRIDRFDRTYEELKRAIGKYRI